MTSLMTYAAQNRILSKMLSNLRIELREPSGLLEGPLSKALDRRKAF